MTVSVKTLKTRQQAGAALMVALIMLLLLTLLGVAGMRDTLLQEKMAGNMRDRDLALQAAEAALRAGEAELQGLTEPTFTNSDGRYNWATGTQTQTNGQRILAGKTVSELVFWNNWDWANNAVDYTKTLTGLDTTKPPSYVIEKLNPALSNKGEYDNNTASSTQVAAVDLQSGDFSAQVNSPDYRITARGLGSSGDAVVFLQSSYRRVK